MELELDGRTETGDVVDLRDRPVDRDALVAAIRGAPSPYAIECPDPGPIHARAGVAGPEMGLKPRTALAAAARSRGIGTPHDERIERLVGDLAALSERIDADRVAPIEVDGSSAAGPPPAEIERLRERTAELRGRVEALEHVDADPTDARGRLREAAARLSELETRRIAVDQTRERTRELRDRRERRLHLEDRLANARRDARAVLVDRLREEFTDAVAALLPDVSDPFAAPPPVAALSVLRVGSVRAPVVLGVDRFSDPASAADWLDAPVVRL